MRAKLRSTPGQGPRSTTRTYMPTVSYCIHKNEVQCPSNKSSRNERHDRQKSDESTYVEKCHVATFMGLSREMVECPMRLARSHHIPYGVSPAWRPHNGSECPDWGHEFNSLQQLKARNSAEASLHLQKVYIHTDIKKNQYASTIMALSSPWDVGCDSCEALYG